MTEHPAQAAAARNLLRGEFERHRAEQDNARIQELREQAVRGITNYLVYTIKREIVDQKTS